MENEKIPASLEGRKIKSGAFEFAQVITYSQKNRSYLLPERVPTYIGTSRRVNQ